MSKIKVVVGSYTVFFEAERLEVIDRSTGGSSGGRLIILKKIGKDDSNEKDYKEKKTIAVFNHWTYWREIEEVEEKTEGEEEPCKPDDDIEDRIINETKISEVLRKASISEVLRKAKETDKKKIVEKGSRKYEKPKEEPKTPEWKSDKEVTMVIRKGQDYKPRHRKGQCICVFHHIDYPCAEGCPKCSK